MKTGGDIFWENVTDCLAKYEYSNKEFSRLMRRQTEFGVYRKNWRSVENSLNRFLREQTMPDNIWIMGVRDALRIIDTENKDYPVEYSDLFTDGFYEE